MQIPPVRIIFSRQLQRIRLWLLRHCLKPSTAFLNIARVDDPLTSPVEGEHGSEDCVGIMLDSLAEPILERLHASALLVRRQRTRAFGWSGRDDLQNTAVAFGLTPGQHWRSVADQRNAGIGANLGKVSWSRFRSSTTVFDSVGWLKRSRPTSSVL